MNASHVKLAFIFATLIIISYMVLIIIGDKGVRDLNAMKQQLSALKAENEELQQINIEMHRKIKRLKEDPKFIENIARQELKMIGKDEIVFKFKEDENINPRHAAEKTTVQMDAAVDKTSENLSPQTDH